MIKVIHGESDERRRGAADGGALRPDLDLGPATSIVIAATSGSRPPPIVTIDGHDFSHCLGLEALHGWMSAAGDTTAIPRSWLDRM